ncbi:MAG: primosomal protein N' [Bacteroidota bacterium]
MPLTDVEVILPLPLPGSFTYRLPADLKSNIGVGYRVIVPLGPKKIYTGIISGFHERKLEYAPKYVLDVLDDAPIVNASQLDFFTWLASYYMCTIGEVINAALPSALKLSSQSFISIQDNVNPDDLDLEEREWRLLRSLKESERSLADVSGIVDLKHPQRLIKKLVEKGLIDVYEKVKDRYQPKKVKKVRLNHLLTEEKELETLFEQLASKTKQLDVLLAYLRVVPVLEDSKANHPGILKSSLLSEDISASSLKTLVKNNVFEEWDEVVSRLEDTPSTHSEPIQLSELQQKALEEIHQSFQSHRVTLLHGVTGSGKTEVYIELIKEQLKSGGQVLYLLPEIALTTQIISRLHRVFGNTFGVYHSRYSDNERVEVWKKVLNQEYQFIVGVRSAVFLPFDRLGLILVDEEHETSYKQFEPAPRYHARDAAIYLATLHDAHVLLGTATPALETYQNALDGKYGLVELDQRFGESHAPAIHFANLLKERKRKKMKGNFSSTLFEAIEAALEKKEQVILFQNRRGYASYISCESCAHIPKCPNCAVSLTYHQFNHKLVCHYCGFNQPMLTDCTNCGSKELRNVGFGTEELEEELKILFPTAIVQRMDLDTTRSKYGYQRIIEAFEEGEIDILVGTQMVSKGLDFDHVNLVGVFDADRMIHFPDFRSHERAYQLIMQVSGRAGRKSQNGKVIVQTNDPEQPVLERVRDGNYRHFFQWEILEREGFVYPPFCRIIRMVFKHREKQTSLEGAKFFSQELRKGMGTSPIIGPVEPIIGKIRNQYLHEITLKIAKKGINLAAVKDYLWSCEKIMRQHPAFKSVGLVFDVDPM